MGAYNEPAELINSSSDFKEILQGMSLLPDTPMLVGAEGTSVMYYGADNLPGIGIYVPDICFASGAGNNSYTNYWVDINGYEPIGTMMKGRPRRGSTGSMTFDSVATNPTWDSGKVLLPNMPNQQYFYKGANSLFYNENLCQIPQFALSFGGNLTERGVLNMVYTDTCNTNFYSYKHTRADGTQYITFDGVSSAANPGITIFRPFTMIRQPKDGSGATWDYLFPNAETKGDGQALVYTMKHGTPNTSSSSSLHSRAIAMPKLADGEISQTLSVGVGTVGAGGSTKDSWVEQVAGSSDRLLRQVTVTGEIPKDKITYNFNTSTSSNLLSQSAVSTAKKAIKSATLKLDITFPYGMYLKNETELAEKIKVSETSDPWYKITSTPIKNNGQILGVTYEIDYSDNYKQYIRDNKYVLLSTPKYVESSGGQVIDIDYTGFHVDPSVYKGQDMVTHITTTLNAEDTSGTRISKTSSAEYHFTIEGIVGPQTASDIEVNLELFDATSLWGTYDITKTSLENAMLGNYLTNGDWVIIKATLDDNTGRDNRDYDGFTFTLPQGLKLVTSDSELSRCYNELDRLVNDSTSPYTWDTGSAYVWDRYFLGEVYRVGTGMSRLLPYAGQTRTFETSKASKLKKFQAFLQTQGTNIPRLLMDNNDTSHKELLIPLTDGFNQVNSNLYVNDDEDYQEDYENYGIVTLTWNRTMGAHQEIYILAEVDTSQLPVGDAEVVFALDNYFHTVFHSQTGYEHGEGDIYPLLIPVKKMEAPTQDAEFSLECDVKSACVGDYITYTLTLTNNTYEVLSIDDFTSTMVGWMEQLDYISMTSSWETEIPSVDTSSWRPPWYMERDSFIAGGGYENYVDTYWLEPGADLPPRTTYKCIIKMRASDYWFTDTDDIEYNVELGYSAYDGNNKLKPKVTVSKSATTVPNTITVRTYLIDCSHSMDNLINVGNISIDDIWQDYGHNSPKGHILYYLVCKKDGSGNFTPIHDTPYSIVVNGQDDSYRNSTNFVIVSNEIPITTDFTPYIVECDKDGNLRPDINTLYYVNKPYNGYVITQQNQAAALKANVGNVNQDFYNTFTFNYYMLTKELAQVSDQDQTFVYIFYRLGSEGWTIGKQ